MIEFSTNDCADDGANELYVCLHSNKYEFSIAIGNHFMEDINLDKRQVSELIVALVEMHKEML